MRFPLICLLLLSAAGCGGPSARWISQLKSGKADERAAAARALSELGPKAAPALPALTEAISDPDVEVRRLSVFAIRQVGADARTAAPSLEKALQDSDKGVRRAAAYAIIDLMPTSKSPAPVLIEAIREGDPRAVVAAGQMGSAGKDVLPALQQALGNSSTLVRVKALESMVKIDRDNRSVQAAIQRAKNDPSDEMRKAAKRLSL